MMIKKENDSYNIKETIVAYFNEEKHGIIRNIPTRNTVTRTDGSTNTNRAKITNVNVNEKYSLGRVIISLLKGTFGFFAYMI